ncbi:hypothetical protein D4740_10605 [Actinomyces sp. 2119]|uniref:hypothetical protein n=1 Tax=Actinomyces sp. 2119 TaxID=2321393 RepID=UPI000E6B977C|nr:hypothetical protein [Actinomyces sp. 2119]RJF40969.1 hypothetical protein D4740_10605 [Actinomyces sp. 2119]
MPSGSALRAWVRTVVIVLAVPVLFLGWFLGCLWYLELRDDIPASWAVELGTLNPELFPAPVDTTAQTCTEDLPCRWAVTSDTAVVMMFTSQKDACQAAHTLPGTLRHDWLAVQFTPGALSVEERANLLLHFDAYERYPYGEGIDDMSWLPWITPNCS